MCWSVHMKIAQAGDMMSQSVFQASIQQPMPRLQKSCYTQSNAQRFISFNQCNPQNENIKFKTYGLHRLDRDETKIILTLFAGKHEQYLFFSVFFSPIFF